MNWPLARILNVSVHIHGAAHTKTVWFVHLDFTVSIDNLVSTQIMFYNILKSDHHDNSVCPKDNHK